MSFAVSDLVMISCNNPSASCNRCTNSGTDKLGFVGFIDRYPVHLHRSQPILQVRVALVSNDLHQLVSIPLIIPLRDPWALDTITNSRSASAQIPQEVQVTWSESWLDFREQSLDRPF